MRFQVPTKLPKHLVLSFKEIYEERIGDKLSYEEAHEKALDFLELNIELMNIKYKNVNKF
ncbi:MAG: hypothetical protein WD048_13170 [Chitinophagales bacterium]